MSSPKTIKDLPIYDDSLNGNGKALWVTIEKKTDKSELESLVSSARQSACNFVKEFQHQKDSTINYYETTKENIRNKVNYISSETNLIPKLAFISLSGLSGLLIGYKKSSVRKLFYTGLLTTGATAVCYPKEAKVFSSKLYEISEQNAKKIYREYIWPEESNKKAVLKKIDQNKGEVEQKHDSKDKIVKLDNEAIKSILSSKNIVGDKGQSTDEDKDMYTTRK